MLTSDCLMSHFDPSAETQLKVDASPFGLGAVLLQGSGDDVRPIAYASRTLNDVERRYSQTEREAWRWSGRVNGFIFTCLTKNLNYTPTTKCLRLSTARYLMHRLESSDGLCVYSLTDLPYIICQASIILPMCYQGCH